MRCKNDSSLSYFERSDVTFCESNLLVLLSITFNGYLENHLRPGLK